MSTKQIGKVNMISNRNNDSNAEYESIQNYVGGSNQELRRFKAPTLEQAIDNVVRNVPGGEYLKNVKIYVLNGKYFAVEGDVWGFRRGANFKGFKVGDKVQWKEYLRTESGIIVDLKDDLTCTVKIDGNGKFKVIKYTELLRSDE
ncbi:MAG TPA: hypothetical protein PKH65_10400 [Bacteroidia bacterium]|nr:hypothetical protein [Bacteroidia bacterium]